MVPNAAKTGAGVCSRVHLTTGAFDMKPTYPIFPETERKKLAECNEPGQVYVPNYEKNNSVTAG
jgi:hypothetical protein